ncbi:hypothetical protein MTR67_036950 [Solanum verrucosum]|uniref:Uncharacterized protein n=1 Tax=Solanum verrucosum TaxID=315347 RepID=A0AAF0ZN52_SOLVR|nr:hypothetical protein MTR67_036950 [Solanum verrucosum]
MKQSIDTTSTLPTCKTSDIAKLHAKGIGTVCGRLLVGTAKKITIFGNTLCANFPPEKMLMFASQVVSKHEIYLILMLGLNYRGRVPLLKW